LAELSDYDFNFLILRFDQEGLEEVFDEGQNGFPVAFKLDCEF